jgi:hypothetical protein
MRFALFACAGAIAVGAAALGQGCSSGGPACVTTLPADCAPLYEPTFDNVYSRTIAPSCAVSGASCHAAEGRQGGLAFPDADAAYAALLGQDGGEARVIPGDAACSEIVERLYATDPDVVMPRGAPLADPERCAVVKWIAAGAKR